MRDWEELDGVSPDRAENLRDDIGTTEDFLEISQELHPNLPPIACLDVITPKSVDGIG